MGEEAPINWRQYRQTFPLRYMQRSKIDVVLETFVAQQLKTITALDIGGSVEGTQALNSSKVRATLLDPYVDKPSWVVDKIDWKKAEGIRFDLAVARGSINYLTPEQICMIPEIANTFIANTFELPPPERGRERKVASKDGFVFEKAMYDSKRKVVMHEIECADGRKIKHEFAYYSFDELASWIPGLMLKFYGKNSMVVYFGSIGKYV